MVFILGSSLAALGGVLYAPLSTLDPYMDFHILILCFAVVIVGGIDNLRGTAVAGLWAGHGYGHHGQVLGPCGGCHGLSGDGHYLDFQTYRGLNR